MSIPRSDVAPTVTVLAGTRRVTKPVGRLKMMLDEAMQWLASKGGKVHLVKRTADDNYYQVVIGPHRSAMIGVAHHGKVDVEPTDPNFEQAFIQMVESIRQKVGP